MQYWHIALRCLFNGFRSGLAVPDIDGLRDLGGYYTTDYSTRDYEDNGGRYRACFVANADDMDVVEDMMPATGEVDLLFVAPVVVCPCPAEAHWLSP